MQLHRRGNEDSLTFRLINMYGKSGGVGEGVRLDTLDHLKKKVEAVKNIVWNKKKTDIFTGIILFTVCYVSNIY